MGNRIALKPCETRKSRYQSTGWCCRPFGGLAPVSGPFQVTPLMLSAVLPLAIRPPSTEFTYSVERPPGGAEGGGGMLGGGGEGGGGGCGCGGIDGTGGGDFGPNGSSGGGAGGCGGGLGGERMGGIAGDGV